MTHSRGVFGFAAVCGLACVLNCTFLMSCIAGEFNPTRSIGDEAPQWIDLPGADGGKHSFADLAESDVVVIAFTCNACPYAVDVEDRLLALAEKHAEQKFSLIAINSNSGEADSLEAMKVKAGEKSFSFAYLRDEGQEIAKAYGATRTPEFFVLDRDRRIVYMGSLDDSPDGKAVTKRHVESAVDAVLNDTEVPLAETVSIGCLIRFPGQRRR